MGGTGSSVVRATGEIHIDTSIVGVCNPVIDVVVPCRFSDVEAWGCAWGDSVLADERQMQLVEDALHEKVPDPEKPGEFVSKYLQFPGGSVLNSLRVAQEMLPPDSTAMIGAVGEDDSGDALEVQTCRAGVFPIFQQIPGYHTAVGAILLDPGREHTMVISIGAAAHFKYEDWDSSRRVGVFKNAKACLISVYFIDSCERSTLGIMVECLAQGVPIAVTLGSVWHLQHSWGPTLRSLLRAASLLFGNEREIPALAGMLDVEGIQGLATWGGRSRTVVQTSGAELALASDGRRVIQVPPVALRPEDIADKIGAGDAFAGGFLAAFVQRRALRRCMEQGHEAAARILRAHAERSRQAGAIPRWGDR